MENLTVKSQAIIALLDNGKMSAKELGKYLNMRQGNAANSMIWSLKKQGLVEHVGYSRYALTEKGRELSGQILSGKDKLPKEEIKVAEIAPQAVIEPVIETPEPASFDKEAWAYKTISEILEIAKSIILK